MRGIPPTGRCLVMGIINVTPDSFSDGGQFFDTEKAIAHGQALAQAGADIVDIGGESTRPGAERVDDAEELRRTVPVVEALAADGLLVSVDTMRASVAAAAVAAGAGLVNDVSGGLADPAMAPFVAEAGVPYVLMHWRGHSVDMTAKASYRDVVTEVRDELRGQLDRVLAAGVRPEQVILDPGIGFAKVAEHDWALLSRLDALQALGRPLLVGASRKRFLGRLLAAADGTPRAAEARADATVAITTQAALAGAWAVRVHDVAANADAVRVAAALADSRAGAAGAGTDRIVLRGLRAHGYHGVLASERETGQEFVVDVALTVDTGPAAAADALALTVDYADLADRLVEVVAGEPADLIETVAGRLADVCLATDGVLAAEVTLHKPQAPVGHPFEDVAVSIVRERGSSCAG
ncbi:MAG: dihydropteroate synthase [Streptosporangiales bacterium]|nr:dihydropteroate synthase [Streptosporangiales bacterium]